MGINQLYRCISLVYPLQEVSHAHMSDSGRIMSLLAKPNHM